MAWINDRELLKMDEARVLLRENLKLNGIITKPSENIFNLINALIDLPSWTTYFDRTMGGTAYHSTRTILGSQAFMNFKRLEYVYFPMVLSIGDSAFGGTGNIKIYSFPVLETVSAGAQMNLIVAKIADLGNISNVIGLSAGVTSVSDFKYLILRRTNVIATLPSTDILSRTPFASDGGKLYVPDALIVNYEEGTNWSSLVGMTVIGLTGSRFENTDWFEKRDGIVTLDGNAIEIIEDETVEMFKYTENLDAIYENGAELDDDELMADHRTVTSEVEE